MVVPNSGHAHGPPFFASNLDSFATHRTFSLASLKQIQWSHPFSSKMLFHMLSFICFVSPPHCLLFSCVIRALL
jgi:hypothetical protein